MSEKIGYAPTGRPDDPAARVTHWRGAAPVSSATDNAAVVNSPGMTDRELLELAARAAGFPAGWVIQGWNPLTDDGDALRLSVKLRMSIDHNPPTAQQPWVSAGRQGCEGCYDPVTCVEDEFDEPQRGTATRRAIVRAAAEIEITEVH